MNRHILSRAEPGTTHTSPARTKRRSRRNLLLPLALLMMTCAAVALLGAGTALSSPALASMLAAERLPSPTRGLPFAQVPLVKPTYTATVTLMPAATSTPLLEPPSDVVDGELFAEVVADTPTAEYVPLEDDGASAADQTADTSAYGGNQYILVDISEQHMYAYGSDQLVFSFVASTGMNNATATGNFSVLDKIPNAYGSTWDLWMPNWLGIYWAGGLENGIHALPILSNGVTLWSGFLGRPISYGCVVLGTYEAELLYDWAEIGTPVEIRW